MHTCMATITLSDIVLLIFGREFFVPVTSYRVSLDSPGSTQLIAEILILYLTLGFRLVIIVEFFSNIALIAKTIWFSDFIVIVYLHI